MTNLPDRILDPSSPRLPDARPTAWRSRRRGFTLVELLVALAMLSIVFVAALVLLDTTSRVTRTQIARADIQQSVRIAHEEMARKLRTAGRGGLLGETTTLTLPTGVALEVDNNVAADRTLFPSDGNSPDVMENTDIVTVRGIFDNPLFYTRPLESDTDLYTFDTVLGTGSVVIERTTPDGGFSQDLELLEEMREKNREGEAVVIVSPFSDDVYGVASVDWASSTFNAANDTFTLAFKFQADPALINADDPGSDVDAASVLSSAGAFPEDLYRSGFRTIGILEEYRYFIRDATVSGAASGRFAPKLSMVRTQINRDEYWVEDPADPPGPNDEPWEDIADYIIDLQVALGFTDPATGEVTETDDGVGDDWFFNAVGDPRPDGDLSMIRVTTLARSAAPDRNSEARVLLRLEDRSYTDNDINDINERRFRRFFMPTVLSLRNL